MPDPAVVVDRPLLEELQRTADIQTTAPDPGLADYASFLLQRLVDAVRNLITAGAEQVGLDDPRVQMIVALVLLGVAVLLALGAVIHILQRFFQLRSRWKPGRGTATPVVRPSAPSRRSAEEWRQQMEAHLKNGEILAALEALWWWLGTSLAGDRLDPAWTSGELVRHTGRRELRREIAQLDRLRYGPDPPAAEAVHSLAGNLEDHLQPPVEAAVP